MLVLGIESSCDETGVGIYDSQKGLLSHALHSQIKTHAQYGGVVPELASRDHIQWLIPLVDKALKEAGVKKTDLDAIAYTAGPGLIGALLVGASFAKTLAMALGIPSLAVHHLEAHLLAAQLDNPALSFPFLALLVSGGHTELIDVQALGVYKALGQTLDDAVGEAFDKTAKLMGLPYPGGAMLAQLADEYRASDLPGLADFPRPMTDRPGLDFSFSGLKTHALNVWLKSDKQSHVRSQIASAFQQAVIETLVIKCKRAVLETKAKTLVVAGGVGANSSLRLALSMMIKQLGGQVYFPRQDFCTDNGAMIAYAGCLRLSRGEHDRDLSIDAKARWPLAS